MQKLGIRETEEIDLDGGYLIDGFPSVGLSSAIATESMIRTSQFRQVGVIESDRFPPVSLVRDGRPNHPARVFVNSQLKVGIFSSYLTMHQSMHREVALAMLDWAKKHGVKTVISSVAVKKAVGAKDGVLAAASTDGAAGLLEKAGMSVLGHGTIPGIPGCLLNEGMMRGQDVVVVLFHSAGGGPDFKASAQLCGAMSRLVPGASCNMDMLQKEAKRAEESIKETEEEARHLRDGMYG